MPINIWNFQKRFYHNDITRWTPQILEENIQWYRVCKALPFTSIEYKRNQCIGGRRTIGNHFGRQIHEGL